MQDYEEKVSFGKNLVQNSLCSSVFVCLCFSLSLLPSSFLLFTLLSFPLSFPLSLYSFLSSIFCFFLCVSYTVFSFMPCSFSVLLYFWVIFDVLVFLCVFSVIFIFSTFVCFLFLPFSPLPALLCLSFAQPLYLKKGTCLPLLKLSFLSIYSSQKCSTVLREALFWTLN